MTRKDFEAIARVIGESACDRSNQAVITLDLADLFQTLNPRFDAGRFSLAVRKARFDKWGEA